VSFTVGQWIRVLPEPYRSQALPYLLSRTQGVRVECASRAVEWGIIWEDTKEGFDYWMEFATAIRSEDIEVSVPVLTKRKLKL